MKELTSSPLLDGILAWLLRQGLSDAGLPEIVQGFGQRLIESGLPIDRIGVASLVLHPVFGARDIVWEAQSDKVQDSVTPRDALQSKAFQDSPFFYVAKNGISFTRFHLEQTDLKTEYPIFEKFRASNITDYLVFFQDYGRREISLWPELPAGMEGAIGSFSTRRIGGFNDDDIEYLRALTIPLSVIVKEKNHHLLIKTLLDTYLGKYSGDHVLNGSIERGDGESIECAILYCDLRGSTRLAESLATDKYLSMLDTYFDCTAGAVLDHGGEVLKFIGDAVMAIFPFKEGRSREEVCRAAISTSIDSLRKAKLINEKRVAASEPSIEFGIALHIGKVMYGNVGTDRRLDFTVIGPAANEAARLESLSKKLKTPVVVSSEFAREYTGELVDLGLHELEGIKQPQGAFAIPEFAPKLAGSR